MTALRSPVYKPERDVSRVPPAEVDRVTKGNCMRQRLFRVGAGVALVVMALPSLAKGDTLKGKVIDQGCYMKDKASNSAVDHRMPAETKDCAIACAKKGQPMALLTPDGKVYQIAGALTGNNNAKLIPHLGHMVELSGAAMDMGGALMIHADDLKVIK
jgi:hypothetical protein